MWPDLPNTGFMRGRAATEEDVRDGNAVFVLRSNDELIGEPLPIDIPQFAVHVDEETGARVPCILMQAERAGPQEIAGVRYLHGGVGAGLLREFVLLGIQPPGSG